MLVKGDGVIGIWQASHDRLRRGGRDKIVGIEGEAINRIVGRGIKIAQVETNAGPLVHVTEMGGLDRLMIGA